MREKVLAGWSLIIFGACFGVFGATELFVSPDGDDGNPGTLNKPFKTVYKARERVREINSSMSDDIIVYLRGHVNGGYHFLDSTWRFTEKDGGFNGHRVIYRAYQDEKPIVSGGVRVTGWTQVPDKPYWQAKVNVNKKIRHMTVNYLPAMRARGFRVVHGENMSEIGGLGFPAGFHPKGGVSIDFPNTDPSDVEMQHQRLWGTNVYCVDTIVKPGASAAFRMQDPIWGVFHTGGNGPRPDEEYILMNAYSFVDQPGEFYFNTTTKNLIYYPRSDEDMTDAVVIVPRVEVLLWIQGAHPTNRVKNITFEGIAFHDDANLLNKVGDSRGHCTVQFITSYTWPNQAGALPDEYWQGHNLIQHACEMLLAENIEIRRCRFEFLGGGGVNMMNDCVNCVVDGNIFRWLGANAVNVGHPEHLELEFTFPQELYPCPPENEYWIPCNNCVVSNNLLRFVSWEQVCACPLHAFHTVECKWLHNDQGPSGYSGFNIGIFDNGNEVARDNLYRGNKVGSACELVGDGGSFYALGINRGTVVDSNYWFSGGQFVEYLWADDSHGPFTFEPKEASGVAKIYPDHGATGYIIIDNVWASDGDYMAFNHDKEGRVERIHRSNATIENNAGLLPSYRDLHDKLDWTPPKVAAGIILSTNEITLHAPDVNTSPDDRQVSLSPRSGGSYGAITVTPSEPWLSASVSGSGDNQTITFSADITGMQSGLYTDLVEVSESAGAVFCTVNLRIEGAVEPRTFEVIPDEVEMLAGKTRRFEAVARDQFNQPLTGITWSAEGGEIDENGVFVSDGSTGSFTVTAGLTDFPDASATATVAVVETKTVPAGWLTMMLELQNADGEENLPASAAADIEAAYAKAGAEFPVDGDQISAGGAQYTWKVAKQPRWKFANGTFDGAVCFYFIAITNPTRRQVVLRYMVDDGATVWMNGTEVATLDLNYNNDEGKLTEPFSVPAGEVGFLFKVTESGGGNQLQVAFNDADGNDITDFKAPFDYDDEKPVAIEAPSPQADGAKVGAAPLLLVSGRRETRLTITTPGEHSVRFFDLSGTLVGTLRGTGPAVYHVSRSTLGSGVYLVRARRGETSLHRKLIVR